MTDMLRFNPSDLGLPQSVYEDLYIGWDYDGLAIRIQWTDKKTGKRVGLLKFTDSPMCLVVVEKNPFNDADLVYDDQVVPFINSHLGA